MARKKPSNRFLVRRTAANALAPINDYAHQKIASIPFGEVVQCEIRFLRNPKFNRLYWGLISMVWENLDHILFPQVENFHDTLKIMAGIREERHLPPGAELITEQGEVLRVGDGQEVVKELRARIAANGEPPAAAPSILADLLVMQRALDLLERIGWINGRFFVPGSTAFHNMDEETFSRFFWFVCDLIVQYWLPMAPAALVREVERLTGIRAPARPLTIAETRQALMGPPDG